jgi:hypothetical protein
MRAVHDLRLHLVPEPPGKRAKATPLRPADRPHSLQQLKNEPLMRRQHISNMLIDTQHTAPCLLGTRSNLLTTLQAVPERCIC